jgi:hypothetical protein
MKAPVQQLSEADVLREFPISGRTNGWYFRVKEVSAGVYLVEGSDLWSRRVGRTGTDPGALLTECAADAAAIVGKRGI